MRSFLALLSSLSLLFTVSLAASPPGYECKCAPDEDCWPGPLKWIALNATVDGNLRLVIPSGSPCYTGGFRSLPTYNSAKCADVTNNWGNPQWHTDQPVTNIWTLWTSLTCDPPPGPVTTPPAPNPTPNCTIGNLPWFVIMAKTPAHIQAGVIFAKRNNLRLVIRNTGHDFMGRSTGWGSLAINTHALKDISFTNSYSGPSEDGWTGGAVTIGAGVQTREIYQAAFNRSPKVTVVGGECATVGISGGWVQGGGHGPMATLHGMGADNALEFKVVTADGLHRTANSFRNKDLFWALRGGGPSTFGVVTEVTFKTFPEQQTAAVSISVATPNSTLMWAGVEAFHKRANDYVDQGMFVYWEMFFGSFRVKPFVAPNMNKTQLTTFLQPLFTELNTLGVPYTTTNNDYPTFFQLYEAEFEGEGAGAAALTGGRIMTRSDITNHHPAIMDAYKSVASPPPPFSSLFGGIVGHIVGPGHGRPSVNNSVNPVWRQASSFSIYTTFTSIAGQATAQDLLTNVWGENFKNAAPNGGAYVNEGDLELPNWQQEYWGSKYPQLLSLKAQYDPDDVFYARTTPGTENWESLEGNTRLCKKL